MPKSTLRDEPKDQRLNLCLTKTARTQLDEKASQLQISLNELVERIGRGEISIAPSFGTLIDQLLTSQEQRVSEVKERINAYTQELKDTTTQLENLRQLKKLYEEGDADS